MREDVIGRANVADTPELDAYYAELSRQQGYALWTVANSIEPWQPQPASLPTLWSYAALRPLVLQALDLVSPEKAGELGPAHRDADAVAALGEGAHHVAAEEARAAEHGDERFEGNGGHAVASQFDGRAEYRIGLTLYRAGLGPFDKPNPASYLSPQSPGGGIGRRTSFRY